MGNISSPDFEGWGEGGGEVTFFHLSFKPNKKEKQLQLKRIEKFDFLVLREVVIQSK